MDIPVYLQIREYPRCSDAPGNSANSEWITLSRCQSRPTRLQVKIMFCHGKTLVRSLNYDQPLRHTRKTPRCSRAPPKAHRINHLTKLRHRVKKSVSCLAQPFRTPWFGMLSFTWVFPKIGVPPKSSIFGKPY